MKTFFKTQIPLIGILQAEKVFPDGEREFIFREENIITLKAKQTLLKGIYLDSTASDPIVEFRVGIGGSVDTLGLFPKPVNQNLEALYNQITPFVATTYVENLAIPAVTFIADLDQSAGSGQLINEAGLFTQSGEMFNIKTFPAITKTGEFNIHFEWTIKMA